MTYRDTVKDCDGNTREIRADGTLSEPISTDSTPMIVRVLTGGLL